MRRFLFFLLILAACSDSGKQPSDVLSQKKMQAVLWDMIAAGEYYSSYLTRLDSVMDKDSARMETYAKVLGIHNIDKATFDRSYAWYKAHPEKMAVILDSLSKINPSANWQNISPSPIRPDTVRKKMLQRPEIQVDPGVQ